MSLSRVFAALTIIGAIPTNVFAQSAVGSLPAAVVSQALDEEFAKSVKSWTTRPEFLSPLLIICLEPQVCQVQRCSRVSRRHSEETDPCQRSRPVLSGARGRITSCETDFPPGPRTRDVSAWSP